MKTPTPIIAVAGLGTMGLGIAALFAAAGFQVLATDAARSVVDTANARLTADLALRVAGGKLTTAARDALLGRITLTNDFAPAALIVEAIVERLAEKQALLAALQAQAPKAVLATNTSSLSVARIAEGTRDPSRVLGLHFFNPAPVMRLVELVAHPGTDPQAVMLARTLTEAAGKTVIDCADRPGFIVNRCARPYYGEALALLEEGRTASDIDAALLTAGYRLGPLALIDLIGADINLAATEALADALHRHPRYHVFDALREQVARGDLGRKSGRGFLHPGLPGAAPADAADIVLRIEAAVINEAAAMLAEGVATRAAIDTALTLGLHWPSGPFAALHRHGAARILATLAALEAGAPPHLRGRYASQLPAA